MTSFDNWSKMLSLRLTILSSVDAVATVTGGLNCLDNYFAERFRLLFIQVFLLGSIINKTTLDHSDSVRIRYRSSVKIIVSL